MARRIIWDGTTIGILIEHEGGVDDYIVPPVVLGEDGHLIQGENLLQAIIDTGVAVQVPMVGGSRLRFAPARMSSPLVRRISTGEDVKEALR